MNTITSTVIICTRNRLSDLLTCLDALSRQTQMPTQLIIVDSSDLPVNTAQKFDVYFNIAKFGTTQLDYIHTAPGLTYQRNIGIGLSVGDVLYFLDDDSIADAQYIEHMNAVYQHASKYAGGMGSVTNIPPKVTGLYRFVRSFFLLQRDYASGRFTASGMPTHAYGMQIFMEVEVLGGCCMSFRREIAARYLFDEKLVRYAYMEDCDISARVSYDHLLFYNPQATLKHMASPLDRDKVLDNRAMYIKNYSYLFFKNFYPRNKFKIFAYCWSVLGLFVEAILIRNLDYIKGYCKGLRQYYFD